VYAHCPGTLPEGNIHPKEQRPIWDLLRKRGHLVSVRTSHIVSFQNIITWNLGNRLKSNDVKLLTSGKVTENEALEMAVKVSKETIDFMTRQIKSVESTIEEKLLLSGSRRLATMRCTAGRCRM